MSMTGRLTRDSAGAICALILSCAGVLGACSSPSAARAIPVQPFFLQAGEGQTPDLSGSSADEAEEPRMRARISFSRFDLARIDIDEFRQDQGASGEVKLDDVQVDRLAFRLDLSNRSVRGFVQLFVDNMTMDLIRDEFKTVGGGGGVSGTPVLGRLSRTVNLILPFNAEANVSYGKEDVTSVGSEYNQAIADEQLTILAFQFEGYAGIGLELFGFQPSVGLALDGRLGGYDYKATMIAQDDFDADGRFDGFNLGGYLGLNYKHREFPLFGETRFHFGNVSGFFIALGVDF